MLAILSSFVPLFYILLDQNEEGKKKKKKKKEKSYFFNEFLGNILLLCFQ